MLTGTLTNAVVQVNPAGALVQASVLNGTSILNSAPTSPHQIENQAVSTSLAVSHGARCDILFLDFGPIFLDVLGTEIQLERVVLDPDVIPDERQLVSNLLCAISKLLDNQGSMQGVEVLLQ